MLVSERENTIFMEPKTTTTKKIEIKFLNGKLLVASYVKKFQLKYVKICRFFFVVVVVVLVVVFLKNA